ncbi:MAG: hypothetical protein HND47_13540 [Chloroflexi bacterium]|nr:hypothetical protein [Chloroflexota bacterium]
MFEDIGNAVASGFEFVGEVVEEVVDVVVDTAEDIANAVIEFIRDAVNSVVDWIDYNIGGFVAGIARFIAGIINGILRLVEEIVRGIATIVRALGKAIGSLIRFDFAGFIRGLGDLALGVINLGIIIVRAVFGGYIVGGVIEQFERHELREFVENLVNERYGHRPDVHRDIRDKLGLNRVSWGLMLEAEHKVFMLDSVHVPLWKWHNEGTIDLYSLAGLLSFSPFSIQHPRTMVRTVSGSSTNNWFPVTRWVISRHLESQGREYRLRVFAMTPQAVAEKLELSVEKCAKLGIKLSWNWNHQFYIFNQQFPAHEIKEKDEYLFALGSQDRYVRDKGLRTGNSVEECRILALGAFHYQLKNGKEGFGQVGGRSISEGPDIDPCDTPDRTDSCCITVAKKDDNGNPAGSSVIHRDVWPSHALRYILPHEIGHYLGLCHYGHDGVQNIMFQLQANSIWDPGLVKYYYQSEPEFTLNDAKNVWRFILDQLGCCLSDKLKC